jgi:hypothetical protein
VSDQLGRAVASEAARAERSGKLWMWLAALFIIGGVGASIPADGGAAERMREEQQERCEAPPIPRDSLAPETWDTMVASRRWDVTPAGLVREGCLP